MDGLGDLPNSLGGLAGGMSHILDPTRQLLDVTGTSSAVRAESSVDRAMVSTSRADSLASEATVLTVAAFRAMDLEISVAVRVRSATDAAMDSFIPATLLMISTISPMPEPTAAALP